MPGAAVFHGVATSTAPQGLGGANRVNPAATGQISDMHFFLWVFIIGILIPGLLLGGLEVGKFAFVFRR